MIHWTQLPALGTVLAGYAEGEPYVSRIFGAFAQSTRQQHAARFLVGCLILGGVAACGESEPEATPTPAPTPAAIVTAPVMSPSPAPIPTPAPEPTPTATPAPTPTPAAQPAPQPVTPRPADAAPPPAATPEPTEPPTAVTDEPAPTVFGVVLPQVGLNVRDNPSVDEGTVQYVALQGEELELTDVITEVDGVVWRQLADGNWVQVQYLEISEAAPEVMAEPTAEPTPADTTTQTIGVVIPEIGLNVRDAPSVAEGAVQYVALQGEELVLTGQIVEAEDAVWYELEDGNWVQGQYLEFNP